MFELIAQAQDIAERAAENWDVAAVTALIGAVSAAVYKLAERFLPPLQKRWEQRREDRMSEVDRLRRDLDEANRQLEQKRDDEVDRLRAELELTRDLLAKAERELLAGGLDEDSSEVLEQIASADLAASWRGSAPGKPKGEGEP